MSRENIVTGIDIGSDKVAVLIGAYGGNSPQLRVLGMSAVPSHGVRKSVIVDLESVLGAVEQSLNAAERMAGFSINSAYVSVSGSHIRSRNSKGVVAVANPDQEITSMDVERVIEAARAVSIPSEREIIHVVPRYFKVDSQQDIRDPVGMTGVRLEAETHIVTATSTMLKNLAKCMNDLGINVDGFVFSGLAAAEVVLTETEKELGVVALDIGAGSSSMCVFVDGVLEYSGSLPIGARHITQDIAVGCRINLDSAEKIKLALTDLKEKELKPQPGESKKDFSKRKQKADKIDLAKLGIEDSTEELSRSALLKGIMYPRMQEIITMMGEKIEEEGLFDQVRAGVVISGGGAETVDMQLVAKRVLGMQTRIGHSKQLPGLAGEIKNPSFAVGVGLLSYARKKDGGEAKGSKLNLSEVFKDLKFGKLLKKVAGLFGRLLP